MDLQTLNVKGVSFGLVNKANLVHNFSEYVYFFSLHVLGDYVPIIRRNNCIYLSLGICHALLMTGMQGGMNVSFVLICISTPVSSY
jgi:hypothetical protein